MKIRILIADDHKIVREGLHSLIEQQPGMEVIGEAEDGHSTVRLAGKLSPDIVIMDIGMPDLNGIEACRQIVTENENVRVLSMHADRRFVSQMLRAGANGYLLKDTAFDELIRALQTLAEGRSYLSAAVTDVVIEDHVRHDGDAKEESAYTILTKREREVLQLLAEGRTTKEVAAELYRSVKTIETHRRNIMEKHDTHSVA